MQRYLVLISFLALSFCSLPLLAQQASPDQEAYVDSVGSKMKYAARIEMPRGHISGICVLMTEDGVIKGSMFNEFGISSMDFVYHRGEKKVKFVNVIKMLDKWYVRRVLGRDMAHVVNNLLSGISTYRNEKYKIDYKFTILEDATEE